jgi:hypothetical protein
LTAEWGYWDRSANRSGMRSFSVGWEPLHRREQGAQRFHPSQAIPAIQAIEGERLPGYEGCDVGYGTYKYGEAGAKRASQFLNSVDHEIDHTIVFGKV